ncbi:MAG: hypothetical protein WC477_02640 [Patescibacteria group bacterium]
MMVLKKGARSDPPSLKLRGTRMQEKNLFTSFFSVPYAPRPTPHAPAFTLVELLVVIAFVMILIGMVGGFGISALRMQEQDRVVQTIRNELVAARNQAMSEREGGRWGVAFATTSIVLFKGSTYGTRDRTYDLFNPFAPGIVITGSSEIVFVPPFGNAATSGAVTTTFLDRQASVTVNKYGMIEAR